LVRPESKETNDRRDRGAAGEYCGGPTYDRRVTNTTAITTTTTNNNNDNNCYQKM